MTDHRPLILTALLEPAAQARCEALRRHYYPAHLNQVPAHISLFHQLPGSELDAVRRRLKAICGQVPPPEIAVTGARLTGYGVALRLRSPELSDVRAELAAGWDTLLIPQDRAGFQPHLTIQNKVTPAAARETLAAVELAVAPFETRAVALAMWRYCDGPWEALGTVTFRGATCR